MSGIRGKDTKPELIIRRGLHKLGFRYRLHVQTLAGCPDLALARHRAVIFIHGCFWHGHDCPLFKWPGTREEFWRAKIEGNRERDIRVSAALAAEHWRVAVVWECAIRGARKDASAVVERVATWLNSDEQWIELR